MTPAAAAEATYIPAVTVNIATLPHSEADQRTAEKLSAPYNPDNTAPPPTLETITVRSPARSVSAATRAAGVSAAGASIPSPLSRKSPNGAPLAHLVWPHSDLARMHAQQNGLRHAPHTIALQPPVFSMGEPHAGQGRVFALIHSSVSSRPPSGDSPYLNDG